MNYNHRKTYDLDLTKVQILNMTTVSLAKYIRDETHLDLVVCMAWARNIKAIYELGVIRGRALR